MSTNPKKIDIPFEEAAILALRSAVKKAIAEQSRAGLPVYIWKDGKVVDLNARKRKPATKRSKTVVRAKKK